MVEDRRVAGGGDRIQGLNRPILQSGHARLDALILRERGHMNLVEGFKELQGFTPDQIENIGTLPPLLSLLLQLLLTHF